MSDDSDQPQPKRSGVIAITAVSVLLALGIVAAGIYYYTHPEPTQPEDQTESIEPEITTDQNVTSQSLLQTIESQLDQLSEDDFNQNVLSDDALNIN